MPVWELEVEAFAVREFVVELLVVEAFKLVTLARFANRLLNEEVRAVKRLANKELVVSAETEALAA